MASPTTLMLLSLVLVLVFSSADETNISAEPGGDVTLTCKLPNNDPVTALEWSRADLTQYVLMYRPTKSRQLDPEDQHPSYVNRVDLKDRRLKDGDASLVLKNVTTDDEGLYECFFFKKPADRRKRGVLETEPICVVNLSVDRSAAPPGGWIEGGSVRLIVGLSVAGVLVLVFAVVICRIVRNRDGQDVPI